VGISSLVFLWSLAVATLAISVRGALVSREKLLSMSEKTRTRNPTVARILCWVGVLFGLMEGRVCILEIRDRR